MFFIKIADLVVKINNKYEYVTELCKDYLIEEAVPDIVVDITDDDVLKEQTGKFPLGYLESLAVYRKIAESMPNYGGVLMHAAVIETEDTGIAFLAKSGTGKTTHISLWHKYLKDKVRVVNGDKPIIRIIDDTVYAYGTPWAGKERLQTNSRTELKNICFVERAESNSCVKITPDEGFNRIVSAVYLDKCFGAMDIINKLLHKCDFYIVNCNMDISAAQVAYEGMNL